ncbi:MAG: hydantoinase/oxoprolinase family protein [Alphaproteobacteria bacterium]|nr:hydantoinase/oxoprolinase family protein [Alphaproteobacteria bacterium]
MLASPTYRVGVDTGGTFTDLVLERDDGRTFVRKVLTTPDDYGRGVVAALQGALAQAGATAAQVERVVHATTVATNIVLEHKGAKTALLTTRGFRDVLEMRRLRIPEMYTLDYQAPPPLVPRRLRLEIAERLGARGEVRIPLDPANVEAAFDRIAAEGGVEAIAIAFLHSYANPAHEAAAAALARARFPDAFVTLSSEILPEIREYERTSTTVINAYLGPALRRYFASLAWHLAGIGVDAPLHVMKSDGAVMTVAAAADRPAYLVESGPAAGVIGAARARPGDLISLDIGGTTAKAAIIEGGSVAKTGDYEVGAGINLSSKLVMGGGYALKLPVVDLSEIGAGGGSLVAIDASGLIRVGPESAGAAPGPVAYDQGGSVPTLTDALVVLGYLNPDYLVGGGLKVNAAKARAAIAERIAEPLGQSALAAAHGIFELAAGTMVRAVKAVSTYRGRDPRDFTLFAFGGNGGVVATAIADLLEMTRVVIPAHPGVFSAHGLLRADLEHELSRAYLRRLATIDLDEMAAIVAALEADVRALMAAEGYAGEGVAIARAADLRYAEQAHELRVPLPAAPFSISALADAFNAEHQRTYGHAADAAAVESVALRVTATLALSRRPLRPGARAPGPSLSRVAGEGPKRSEAGEGLRAAYFGDASGPRPTPVLGRADLTDAWRVGPLIVEEYDATCVVPPGWRARRDSSGNIELTSS